MTSHSLPKRAGIFSPPVLSQISKLVAEGLSAAEIAEKIGCTLGTLRVKCSLNGISLRRSREESAMNSERKPHTRIVIHLGRSAAVRLQQTAQNRGTTGPRLAAALLEAIVQDNLYDAVIDREIGASDIDRAQAARRCNKAAPSDGSDKRN